MAATTPPGAERREEADKAGTGNSAEKTLGSLLAIKLKKSRYRHVDFGTKSICQRCRVLYPAGRFLRGEEPLKHPPPKLKRGGRVTVTSVTDVNKN